MIGLVFYLALLDILGILIVIILRQKGSYFRSVQMLFITTFSSFTLKVLCDLTKNYLLRSESIVPFTTMIGLSAALTSATALEHTALTLSKGNDLPWKNFFSKENVPSIIFKAYVISLLFLTWTLTPFRTELGIDVFGNPVYIPVYQGWYLLSLSAVAIVVIAYSSRLLVLSSRQFGDKEVARALKWLGVCWSGISLALIFFHGFVLSYFRVEMLVIEYLLITFLLGITTHFFGGTTVLEGFFDKPYPTVPISEGEIVLLTYTSKADKMKAFSTFIREGIANGDRITYIYPDEENGVVKSKLATYGIDVYKYERDGTLFMKSLSEFFMSDGGFDREGPIQLLLCRRAQAKQMKCKVREIEDVGDFSFLDGQWQKYVDYWNDPGWGAPPGVGMLYEPFILELTAINVEGMSEVKVRDILKSFGGGRLAPTKLIDLIAHSNVFSKTLGLTRQELAGRIILFEFDPTAHYEQLVRDFVTEALANVEPVALFTRKSSNIYSALSNIGAFKLLLLTQHVSTPQTNSNTNEILLPATNTPLLLDALEKMLKTSPNGKPNIVFDNLSSLVLLVGFEKTYNFVRYALDMLASNKSTALFLFSPDIHDQKVASSLRSLFINHVSYRKGTLQIAKLPQLKAKE